MLYCRAGRYSDTSPFRQRYPNPAADNVTLDMTIQKAGRTSITVNNLLGEQVAIFEKGTMLNAGRYNTTFSTVGLTSGIYFVTLKNENETIVRKLCIEK